MRAAGTSSRGCALSCRGSGSSRSTASRPRTEPRRSRSCSTGAQQLLVYHLMFGVGLRVNDDSEACTGCSFVADHFDAVLPHLNGHDVTLISSSIAPLDKLLAYKRRMGWRFPWVSAVDSNFHHDFGVAFSDEEQRNGAEYNYAFVQDLPSQREGMSAFALHDGCVYHTYSTYGRGVESLISGLVAPPRRVRPLLAAPGLPPGVRPSLLPWQTSRLSSAPASRSYVAIAITRWPAAHEGSDRPVGQAGVTIAANRRRPVRRSALLRSRELSSEPVAPGHCCPAEAASVLDACPARAAKPTVNLEQAQGWAPRRLSLCLAERGPFAMPQRSNRLAADIAFCNLGCRHRHGVRSEIAACSPRQRSRLASEHRWFQDLRR